MNRAESKKALLLLLLVIALSSMSILSFKREMHIAQRDSDGKVLGVNWPNQFGGFISPSLTSISAAITSPNTSGEAPFAVHVTGSDTTAVGETRIYENLEYTWDFGDDSSDVTFTHPVTGDTVNSNSDQTGPEAAHLYKDPGTYTITLTVRGWTGSRYITDTATKRVTITSWSGENMYFDPVNGNDSNSGASAGSAKKTFSAMKTWLTGGNGRQALLKRGTTMDAYETIYLNKVNKRIGAYGSGANPIIQTAAPWTGAGSIFEFYGNGNEVGNMVINGVDLRNDGVTSSALSMYSKNETVGSPQAAGDVHDIVFMDFTIDIDTSGNPIVFTGDGPKRTVSLWNLELDHGTAVGRQTVYASSIDYFAIMGGSMVGGNGHRILDHHIYPNHIIHGLYRWIDFNPAVLKNFCINTNAAEAAGTTKYTLIAENDCDGMGNGFDMSNGNNNHVGYFDEIIIQGNGIHDLGLNGQGNGIMGYSVDRYTIRDNVFYNNPQYDLNISDTQQNGLIYRNKFYHSSGGGLTYTPGGTAKLIENIFVAPSETSQIFYYNSANANWQMQNNQYWFPNSAQPFRDLDTGSRLTFAQWQAAGYDLTSVQQDPEWADPANGNFSASGSGPVCGNGVVETGEQCDDGNRLNGDGCSSSCGSCKYYYSNYRDYIATKGYTDLCLLSSLSNVRLKMGDANVQVDFSEGLDLRSVANLNLNNAVISSDAKSARIRFDADETGFDFSDKPATITVTGLTIAQEDLVIKHDGAVCDTCTVVSYTDAGNGTYTLVFSVDSWSQYDIEELEKKNIK